MGTYRDAESRICNMSDRELVRTWDALASPYQPTAIVNGVTMDEWATMVKSELERRNVPHYGAATVEKKMETGVTIYINQEWELEEIHILEGINRDETYKDPDTGEWFVRVYEGELPARIKIHGPCNVTAEPLMQPD